MKVQSSSPLRGMTGGALLMLAALQYLVLEAVTAAGWQHPAYNYAKNFISDLGNPVPGDVFDGRVIDSPLHLVMDTAFIAQGTLFIAAAVLLYRVAGRRLRGALLALAILHGTGVIMVGLFHESSAALHNGVIIAHSIGAALAIVAGNAIAITAGTAGRRLGLPAWYRILSVTLGIAGLAAFVLLQADHPLYVAAGGVPERIAVYTILAWEAATGLGTVLSLTRSRGAVTPATRHEELPA